MTLATTLLELRRNTIAGDLQSITGVWLEGLLTDYTDVLAEIQSYSLAARPSAPTWSAILGRLGIVYGNPLQAVPTTTAANAVTYATRLLSVDYRDHNFFNYLLGYGARDQSFTDMRLAVQRFFNLATANVNDPDFIASYLTLLIGNLAGQQQRIADPVYDRNNVVVDFNISDINDSKLYLKLDLSEWIYLHNCDLLYVVVETPQSLSGYNPLGRTTVWLSAHTQIQHVRSKTAKTFLRGQIAQRLKIEDVESNLAGFINTIFDTDSEAAYSTVGGPC